MAGFITFVSFVLGFVGMVFGATYVMVVLPSVGLEPYSREGFAWVSASALVLFWLGFVVGQAVLLLLLRGPSAVRFASISSCQGFSSWLYWSWDFYYAEKGGRQVGCRIFGVELAYEGAH